MIVAAIRPNAHSDDLHDTTLKHNACSYSNGLIIIRIYLLLSFSLVLSRPRSSDWFATRSTRCRGFTVSSTSCPDREPVAELDTLPPRSSAPVSPTECNGAAASSSEAPLKGIDLRVDLSAPVGITRDGQPAQHLRVAASLEFRLLHVCRRAAHQKAGKLVTLRRSLHGGEGRWHSFGAAVRGSQLS